MNGSPLARLLVVAGQAPWVEALCRELATLGMDVLVAEPSDQLGLLAAQSDVAVVDVTDSRGIELCRLLRSRSGIPILAAGRAVAGDDLVDALEAGADSFVSTAISPRVMGSVLRALLRRSALDTSGDPRSEMVYGLYRLDPARRQVWFGDAAVVIDGAEYIILEALLRRPGSVVTREQLIRSCGEPNRVLDLRVRRLRAALEVHDSRRRVATVRGVGFRFDTTEALG